MSETHIFTMSNKMFVPNKNRNIITTPHKHTVKELHPDRTMPTHIVPTPSDS
jgi:hypothetical protein